MIAPTRRKTAAFHEVPGTKASIELWQDAARIRDEWLAHGLSTAPADRPAAEDALAGIYARISRPRPRFEWVNSPFKALPLVAGLPTLDTLYQWIRPDRRPPGMPPLASDLAASLSRLRSALSENVLHADPELAPAYRGKTKEPWPERPPLEALSTGVPLRVVLHQGVRKALYRSLADGFFLPVRAALGGAGPLPVCWYGQQDASWIAYYDMLERLGFARYLSSDRNHFDDWAALARSCGWWWPGEDVCVVVERPAAVVTAEGRLSDVEYRDGWRPPGR